MVSNVELHEDFYTHLFDSQSASKEPHQFDYIIVQSTRVQLILALQRSAIIIAQTYRSFYVAIF